MDAFAVVVAWEGDGCKGKGCVCVADARVFAVAPLGASSACRHNKMTTVCGFRGLDGCVRGWARMTLHPERHISLFFITGYDWHIPMHAACTFSITHG